MTTRAILPECKNESAIYGASLPGTNMLPCRECGKCGRTAAQTNEIATLRAEVARLTEIRDKAAETMRTWHKELTTLREEVINLRELLGNYTGEEDNQPL